MQTLKNSNISFLLFLTHFSHLLQHYYFLVILVPSSSYRHWVAFYNFPLPISLLQLFFRLQNLCVCVCAILCICPDTLASLSLEFFAFEFQEKQMLCWLFARSASSSIPFSRPAVFASLFSFLVPVARSSSPPFKGQNKKADIQRKKAWCKRNEARDRVSCLVSRRLEME